MSLREETVRINTNGIQKRVQRAVAKIAKRKRSQVASVMNKETRAVRKEAVESLMVKTGLKRKILNDRLSITRANPKGKLETRITPLFGRRIYMMDYPIAATIARGAKKVIRLLSPIYRKNMRTGFFSKDKSRMFLRLGDKGQESSSTANKVIAVRGRTVPRLFTDFGMKAKHEPSLRERIRRALRSVLGK